MTRILVTTDGSPLGHHALDHATNLARALGAEVTVTYVQLDPAAALIGEFGYLPPTSPEEIAESLRQLREDLAARVPEGNIVVEPAGGRHVSRAILDVAREQGADLIVMSTHGRSGLGRALLGSVAEAVAHHSPVPVLLVKGDQTPAVWSGRKDGQSS